MRVTTKDALVTDVHAPRPLGTQGLVVLLSAEELRRIDAIAPKGVAVGERYSEAGMRAVNR